MQSRKGTSIEYYKKRMLGPDGLPPKVLYKFYPLRKMHDNNLNENLLNSITEGYLWHSNPNSFNDPFDCYKELIDYRYPTLEYITEYVNRYFNAPRRDKRAEIFRLNKHPEQFIKAFKLSTPVWNICCFTNNSISNTMWSHYANNHTGVCLVFNNKIMAKSGILTSKVTYEKDFRPVDYFANPEDALISMITTKSIEWSYEKEYRSFEEQSGKIKFYKKGLIEVIFGCKCSVEDIILFKQHIMDSAYKDVKWSQARMQLDSFDLAISEL